MIASQDTIRFACANQHDFGAKAVAFEFEGNTVFRPHARLLRPTLSFRGKQVRQATEGSGPLQNRDSLARYFVAQCFCEEFGLFGGGAIAQGRGQSD